jgi:hypothetical protein
MSSLFCIVPEKSPEAGSLPTPKLPGSRKNPNAKKLPEAGSLPMPKLPGSRKNPNAKKSSRRTLPAGGSNLFIFIDYSMG